MVSLTKLKQEKAKLLRLAKKQRIARMKVLKAKREEMKLKEDIAKLKSETSKSFISKVKRSAKSPETKRRIKKGKKILKGIDKFIRSLPS